MANILIHITCGPENPTKAALGFLVAKSAIGEGHKVTLFLAGDGAQLIKKSILDNLVGLGTGKLREHFDAIAASGSKIYVSGMSGKSRGMTDAELTEASAEFAMPDVLVKLAMSNDKIFTY
jgi:predicted peroxiredoxin